MVTLTFNEVYIDDWYTIAGMDEYHSNIKNINEVIKDYYFKTKTFEECESKMQGRIIDKLTKDYFPDLIVGGDLSNQLGTLNKTMANYNISFLGVYSACASFIESLIILGVLIDGRNINNGLAITSSHSKTSERQFRYPNEYGNCPSPYQTITITCAIGCNLTNIKTKYKIVNATIGSVVDYGINDAKNMGAVMAPSCAKTIYEHLNNTGKRLKDYDLVLTGDLGILGFKILKDLLKELYDIEGDNIIDAGSIIYKKSQKKCCGGSGPSVIPFVLFNNVLHNKKYKKILVVGTGSLHNTTLVNQKNTIPSISHAIEVIVNV